MGQHKHNPTAIAAARGEIAPKRKPKPVKFMDWRALLAMFMPKRHDSEVEATPGSKRSGNRRRLVARATARKREAMTHLFPPQSGSRRPQFSSAIPGQWSAESAA